MTVVTPFSPLSVSADEYRSQLEDCIRYEREIERKNNKERVKSNSIPSLKRSDLGFADGAQPISYRKGTVSIQLPSVDRVNGSVRDEVGFFEKQEVLLQFGHTESQAQNDEQVIDEEFVGTIVRIRKDTIDVLIKDIAIDDKEERIKEVYSEAEFVHVGEILNPTRFDREEEAVRGLGDDTADTICGDREALFDKSSHVFTRSSQHDSELYENREQSKAISMALATQDISCIQGPPGTGKTRVIIEIIRRFVEAGETVLVTAESHQAVSNILVGDSTIGSPDPESLHYHARINGFTVNRVNPKPDKIGAFEKTHYAHEKGGGDVYITTNNSAGTIEDQVDVAIVDEATQARQESTCIPISKADKTILVGDHKQLGPKRPYEPDIDQEQPTADFPTEVSLFSLLYEDEDGVFGEDLGVMFDTQYRMHPDIAEFPAQEFYDGRLKTGGEVGILERLQPVVGFNVRNRHSGNAESNFKEAEEIGKYVTQLIKNKDISPDDIGIAAAYSDQVSELKMYFRQTDLNSSPILIQTFDSFQGSERPVMVLSFTRSNSNGNIGFLRGENGKRRLNVAITRAKNHCVLFADWDTFESGDGLYQRLSEYITNEGRMNDLRETGR